MTATACRDTLPHACCDNRNCWTTGMLACGCCCTHWPNRWAMHVPNRYQIGRSPHFVCIHAHLPAGTRSHVLWRQNDALAVLRSKDNLHQSREPKTASVQSQQAPLPLRRVDRPISIISTTGSDRQNTQLRDEAVSGAQVNRLDVSSGCYHQFAFGVVSTLFSPTVAKLSPGRFLGSCIKAELSPNYSW